MKNLLSPLEIVLLVGPILATSITFRSMSRAAQAVGLQIKLSAEPMSPDDLGKLARRLAKSKSRPESAKLADKITTGFYAGA